MRRRLLIAGGMLVVIVAAVAVGAYVYARRSLPRINGTIHVEGLSGPVEIVRDADAIPHIFAAAKRDALFGLGYVHAQDRLWQMEFQRRIGHGTLSEVFGAATIPQDRFLRTVGFGRAARSAWDRLPDDARQQIDAYIAGVNAFLADDPALPPEFTLLGFRPAPWTGADVLVWVKMMAWDLSANYSHELLRRDLLARVGPERTAELLPKYPDDGLSIIETGPHAQRPHAETPRQSPLSPASASWSAALASALTGHEAVRRQILGGARLEALGSNNWVVDGTMTASGKPLLANDPHLGTHVPSLWYLAHMSAGDFDVIGATLPGAPAMAIGRNRYIAWGETNVAADVQDLYRERIDPTGKMVEYRGALEPLTILRERIVVSGGEPVEIDVRISRHGPLVSDAINTNNAAANDDPKPEPIEPLAFRWTALDESDDTVVAFLRLNDARNWDDFTAALRHFVVPSQNFVYADVDGHIGYYLPGRIPVRASGDGSSPAEGWTGEMEWTGWIPFDELPHAFDPPEHFIVTANHRPMGAGYPYHISLEFPDPYRAQRILERLRGGARFTVDDFRNIQADTISLHARTLLPLLISRARPQTDPGRRALEILRQWDFNATADSAAAPIFQSWFLGLAAALAGDELGPVILDDYRGRFSYTTRFVTNTLASNGAWCDDTTTNGRESCDDVITRALNAGVADLTTRLGPDLSRWRWDAVHRAVFPHQGLDTVGPLRPLLSRSIPNAGDWSTINVGTVLVDRPYTQEAIPGYRQIVDLSPANDSRFIDAVGQSGHFLSPHYDDFMTDWRDVQYRKMRMTRTAIDEGALGRLVLSPSPAN